MTRHLLRALLPAGALLIMTGCMDKDYDLNDLDKTSAIKVNDLVLPLNVADITLENVIDTDDPNASFITLKDNQGKEYYAFRRTGDFHSDDIKIKIFEVHPPTDLEPTTSPATKKDDDDPDVDISASIKYEIEPMEKKFKYEIKNVEDKVKSVDEVETPSFYITVSLTVPQNMMTNVTSMIFKNIKIKFPKNLREYANADGSVTKPAVSNIGKYDAETGILTIDRYVSTKAETDLTIKANVLDLGGIENVNNTFDYQNEIDFLEGEVILNSNNIGALQHDFVFAAKYKLPGFDVTRFTGDIDYTIEGLDFDPVDLSDMPDVLDDPQTKIKLANPQIYLTIHNTCEPYNIGGSLGLELSAIRPEGESSYPLPTRINVFGDHVDNKYAISPAGKSLSPIAGYTAAEGTELIEFTDLSNVLYGSADKGYGIPRQIEVGFETPHIYGKAKRFPLGKKIDAVSGDYQFLAPIALDNGSMIVYTGKTDDWGLDDLKVSKMNLTTTCKSTLPAEMKLYAYLLNKKGDKMGKCEPIIIPANSEEEINFTIVPAEGEGEYMMEVDGLYYEAIAVQNNTYDSPNDVPVLTPEMNLSLGKLQLKVTGEYVTDFEDKDDE